MLHTCDIDAIGTIEKKGPAQQPKKPHRKPRKGTRPETKIKMSADVKLEVGDVVLLDNGGKGIVKEKDISTEGSYAGAVFVDAGKYNHSPEVNTYGVWFFDKTFQSNMGNVKITHKIIPYQEPAKEEKSPEQEAFEKGYWIPFVATANSMCPEWAKDVDIDLLLKNGTNTLTEERKSQGRFYLWHELSNTAIVAYRKAKQ